MLVLSRHVDEKVIVELEDGRLIELMPVDLRGDKVRIGITAPRTIRIHREEVYAAILASRRSEQMSDVSDEERPPAA